MTANGQLADNQLVNFYGVRLAPQAAADGDRMVNAAALAGFVIRPLVVKDAASGYRPTRVQAAMRYAQAHGHAADYKLLPSPPAPPLAPVGESRHGQGRACDWVWQSPGAFAWLRAHGATYNWRFWDLGRDKPHMEHDSIAHDVVTWTEPGLSTAGGSSLPLPDTTTIRPKGNRNMAQVIWLPAFPSMPDTDPRIAKIKGYVGGAGVTNFTPKAGVYALVGDSPGTRANVQVSQSDTRLNEWCADHTGSLGAPYNVSQAARAHTNLDEFLALCDAYLTSVQK